MPKAGAVSGVAPASPAGSQDGAVKGGGPKTAAQLPEAKTAEGKPSAPPLPETSHRAPPEIAPKTAAALAAPKTAVALAATLAGLKVGQELRGTVRLLPSPIQNGQTPPIQTQAVLTTPEGDFLISPATGLPDGEVSLVLTRADRSISALLLSTDRAALDPPRPVQLTLVSVRGVPVQAVPATGADGTAPAPAPVQQKPGQPGPGQPPLPPTSSTPSTQAAEPDTAPPLTSLLPGETVSLRGGGSVALPQTAPSQTSAPASRPPLPTQGQHVSTPQSPPQYLPRAVLHGLMLPDVAAPASATGAGAPVQVVQAPEADPLAALFDRGVLPLTLHTGTGPAKRLSASLLATTAPGETSPLTHPPASSPLARLAETGRLVTATALPPDGAAPAAPAVPSPVKPAPASVVGGQVTGGNIFSDAPLTLPEQAALQTLARRAEAAPLPASRTTSAQMIPTPPQAATQTAPPRTATQAATGKVPPDAMTASAAPQGQPVRLSINGTGARLELPAGTPAPAAGTQLVFLVTKGHEALQALPVAEPKAQPQAPAQARPELPGPAATDGSDSQATSPVTAGRPAVTAPVAAPAHAHAGASNGASTGSGQTATTAPPPHASMAAPEARTASVGANSTPATPASPPSASFAAPASTAPSTALPTAADTLPPEMPELPILPALGLTTGVTPVAPHAAVSGGEALLMAVMQALGRKGFAAGPRDPARSGVKEDGAAPLPDAPALARLLQTAAAAAPARAETAQDAPAAASTPDSLPFALTLQTPQGQIPLVFLVWQPVRAEEDGKGDGGASGDGEAEICFAVEVEFESVGRLRLRGAVGQTHLNLGIETEQPLGEALERAAARDFTQAIEAGGMTGGLVFRHRRSG